MAFINVTDKLYEQSPEVVCMHEIITTKPTTKSSNSRKTIRNAKLTD